MIHDVVRTGRGALARAEAIQTGILDTDYAGIQFCAQRACVDRIRKQENACRKIFGLSWQNLRPK